MVGLGDGVGTDVPTGRPAGRSVREAAVAVLTEIVGLVSLATVVLLVGLLGAVTAPRALGWDAHLVVSGSMAPALQPGDVALTAPPEWAVTPPVGAVVVVAPAGSAGRPYIHRVVDVSGGELRTRGDANAEVDPVAVDPDRVTGQLRLVVPVVGLPSLWLAEGRSWAVAGAVAALGLVVDRALAVLRGAAPRPGPWP